MALEALSGPEAIVARMRREIEAATGCTASAGIGPNPLLARLATKKAKPNGQLYIRQSEVWPWVLPPPYLLCCCNGSPLSSLLCFAAVLCTVPSDVVNLRLP